MLWQNVTRRAQYPIRSVGGATASPLQRTEFGVNQFSLLSPHASDAGWSKTTSFPAGWRYNNGWMPSQSDGTYWAANLGPSSSSWTVTCGSLNVAAGINLTLYPNTADFTFSVPNASLQLIVSATGTTSIVFTIPAGTLAGVLYGVGNAAATFTSGSVLIGAIVDGIAAGTIIFTAAATPRAVGHLAGDITPYTTLSPENLAAAVWNAVAGDFNDTGSMGEKVNDAGSAANPWTEVIESGYTAAEILRVLAAVAAGKKSVDGGTVTFRDLGDTKDRVTGTVANSERTAVTLEVD